MPEVAANATEAVLADWLVAENVAFAAGDADRDRRDREGGRRRRGRGRRRRSSRRWSPPASQVEVGDADRRDRRAGRAGRRPRRRARRARGRGADRRRRPRAPRRARTAAGRPRLRCSGAGGGARAGAPSGRVFASPLARRLAKDARPRRRGPRRHRPARPDPAPRRRGGAAGPAHRARVRPLRRRPPPSPAPAPRRHGDVPHSRMRRAIAARLTESKHDRAALLPPGDAARRRARSRCGPS